MSFWTKAGNSVKVNHLHSTQNERELTRQIQEMREDIRTYELNKENAFSIKDGAPLTKRSPYVSDRYGLNQTRFADSGHENSWKEVETAEQSRPKVLANYNLKKLDIW